jgi:hypothetical protein
MSVLQSEIVDMKVALAQEIKEQFQSGKLARSDEQAIRNYVHKRCTNYWYHLNNRNDLQEQIIDFVK